MKNFIKDNWCWLVSLVLVVIALGLVDVQNIKIEHCVLLTIALTAVVVCPVMTAIFCKCRKQRYPQTAQLISSISFVAMVLFWRLPISFYWSWLPYAILIIASAYLPKGNTNTMAISILLAFGSVYSYTGKADVFMQSIWKQPLQRSLRLFMSNSLKVRSVQNFILVK